MQAIAEAGAQIALRDEVEPRHEIVERVLREEHPQLFQRAVGRRAHDLEALGAVLLFFAALLGLGVWMVVDVADGLAIASACDGKCVEVRR